VDGHRAVGHVDAARVGPVDEIPYSLSRCEV
jgi:hypothetical protein